MDKRKFKEKFKGIQDNDELSAILKWRQTNVGIPTSEKQYVNNAKQISKSFSEKMKSVLSNISGKKEN